MEAVSYFWETGIIGVALVLLVTTTAFLVYMLKD